MTVVSLGVSAVGGCGAASGTTGAAAGATDESTSAAAASSTASAAGAASAVSGTQDSSAAASSGSADQFSGRELNLAIFEGGYGRDYWDEMVKEFEAAYPGVKVNMQISPQIDDIIRPQIVAGEIPDFIQDEGASDMDSVLGTMLTQNKVEDLTDVFDGNALGESTPLKDKIRDGVLASRACAPYGDGKVYVAPNILSPTGVLYNKTLFDKNGWKVPETWDEMFALGDETKKQGVALMTYAGIYPSYIECMLWPALASAAGMDVLDKISDYDPDAMDDPAVLQVLQNVAKIGTGGYLLDGTVGLNHTQSQSDFMLDKAALIPNGDWVPNEMKDAPRTDNFQFAMTAGPKLDASETTYVYASVDNSFIPSDAKNKDVAKEFMRFLYTDSSIKAAAKYCNGLYATKNAAELAQGLVDDDILAMSHVLDNSTVIIFRFATLKKDSKIVPKDEFYAPLSDVMTGKQTAEQWRDDIKAMFQKVQAEQK